MNFRCRTCGGPAGTRTLEACRDLQTASGSLPAELDRRGLGAELEVDGGIDEQTAPIVVRAGARVLVAGSAVFDVHPPWEAVRRIRAAGMAALPEG